MDSPNKTQGTCRSKRLCCIAEIHSVLFFKKTMFVYILIGGHIKDFKRYKAQLSFFSAMQSFEKFQIIDCYLALWSVEITFQFYCTNWKVPFLFFSFLVFCFKIPQFGFTPKDLKLFEVACWSKPFFTEPCSQRCDVRCKPWPLSPFRDWSILLMSFSFFPK